LKAVMDAIFGWRNFRNEIVWCYKSGGASPKRHFSRKHDLILWYSKSGKYKFNPQTEKSYNRGFKPYRFAGVEEFEDERGWYTLVGMKDYWELDMVGRTSKERTGYPTQKPLRLYERIIKASSNEGDIVLDPFCGCATTLVAAERSNRRWVGIDLWKSAHELVQSRLRSDTEILGQHATHDESAVTLRSEPPARTDEGDTASEYLQVREKRIFQKQPWMKLSRAGMTELLAGAQSTDAGEVVCAGCGRRLHVRFMHLDHIDPRSGGGSNYIINRVLLCAPCNQAKGNKHTMPQLHKNNRKDGWMENEDFAKRALKNAREKAEQVMHENIHVQRDMFA